MFQKQTHFDGDVWQHTRIEGPFPVVLKTNQYEFECYSYIFLYRFIHLYKCEHSL